MALGEGQSFAGYTVVRRLGAGGMGEVYLARHPRLPRNDALKLLTGDGTADPSYRERFLREADLASALWHQHIVGVHDRGEYQGQLWISMDYVDGEDAASLIARKYPAGMPVDKVVAIVTAVASALDYAHKRGLLHRDVKPSNILLTHEDDDGDQRIMLTDFGIARAVDDSSGLTETNMTVGTVDYAAPEQLMGEDIDGRADQYSLAATAYQLLTGAPPFRDSNAAVVIGRHLNSEPPALAAIRGELAPLDSVMAVGLAKDPRKRFPTCSDFARALAEQASGQIRGPSSVAPTLHAPKADRPETPKPLAPGWYPDPSGAAGTLYWDGRGWHTAPFPKAEQSAQDAGSNRSGLWMIVSAAAVAVALVIIALVFARSPDSEQPDTSAAPTSSYPEPTFTTSRTLTPTTPIKPSTETPQPTVAAPSPPPRPSPPASYWPAMIVGTCDEGGSCGVQQRVAPYIDAVRLHPNDLRDGMTVQVVCRTLGDLRSSSGHGSSYTWYRLANGAYVNAVYTTLKTPIGLPEC